jgi:hypothetical protein
VQLAHRVGVVALHIATWYATPCVHVSHGSHTRSLVAVHGVTSRVPAGQDVQLRHTVLDDVVQLLTRNCPAPHVEHAAHTRLLAPLQGLAS